MPDFHNIQEKATNDFIDRVKVLISSGQVADYAQIVNALNWNKSSMSSVMKRSRLLPLDVYARLNQVYGEQKSSHIANEPEPSYETSDLVSRRSLERTLEHMAEDKIRSTAIIERLIAMLDKSFNSGTPGKAAGSHPATSTEGETPAKQEDLSLGKKYSEKDRHEQKDR